MRILLDENFPLQLYRRLKEAGYDVEHIIALGLRGLPDEAIRLRLAVEADLIFLTHDTEFAELPADTAGTVVISRVPHCPSPDGSSCGRRRSMAFFSIGRREGSSRSSPTGRSSGGRSATSADEGGRYPRWSPRGAHALNRFQCPLVLRRRSASKHFIQHPGRHGVASNGTGRTGAEQNRRSGHVLAPGGRQGNDS